MWNRRKDEEFMPVKPASPPPAPVESRKDSVPKKETSTMSTPGRMPEPYTDITRGGPASLGKSVMVKGQIVSREDLTIDGEVEGTIELHDNRLTIGPNGRVTANIKAREIIVLGTLNGNLEASDKVDIRKEARLVGDIKSARVVIEDGAFFKGSIDIVKPDPPKPAPPPKAQPSAQSQPQQPVAHQPAAAGASDSKR
jgi:cytoskeletal protein CcmA (bactofilin family)